MLMPALFSALRELIPSSHQHFLWSDAKGELTNYYLEGEYAHLVPLYLAEYYNRREREVINTLPDLMRTEFSRPAGDLWARLLRVDRQVLLRSDYYGLLIEPAGMTRRIIVKITEGRNPLGALILDRNSREPEFSPRDFALLDVLHGFIAHGLRGGPGEEGFSDTEDRALAIADREGGLLHHSTNSQRLLAMALVPQWTQRTAHRMQQKRPPEIALLCRRLSAAFADQLPGAAPVLRKRNAWGEFVLRAYWLGGTLHLYQATERSTGMRAGLVGRPRAKSKRYQPADHAPKSQTFGRLVLPGSTPFIGITIERRQPRSLTLLNRIEALPLTEREKQVCLLLARGENTEGIAQVMGVHTNTIITHRRSLYAKLGVPNRIGLINRLQVN